PLCPDYYHWILGSIYFQTECHQSAIEALEPVNHHPQTARLLAACSAMAGHMAEARRYAAITRETYPDFRLEQLPSIVPDKIPGDTQRMIEALKLSGLE